MKWQIALSRWMYHAKPLCALVLTLNVLGLGLVAQQIPVLQRQGAIHGFLLLLDESGKQIAVGEQINVAKGSEIRSRLVFKFTDGSLDDETTVYTQGTVIQLIRNHHIQKGPSFPNPVDISIDVPGKQVTWTDSSEKNSQQKHQHMDLPSNLVNGLIAIAVENFPRGRSSSELSYLAISSKPRVVKVNITPEGNDQAQVGSTSRRADRFNLHFDLGGVAGIIAPVIGKQPPDIKLWVSGGEAPIFLKMSGPLYEKGPVWTMVLTAPTWPNIQH